MSSTTGTSQSPAGAAVRTSSKFFLCSRVGATITSTTGTSQSPAPAVRTVPQLGTKHRQSLLPINNSAPDTDAGDSETETTTDKTVTTTRKKKPGQLQTPTAYPVT